MKLIKLISACVLIVMLLGCGASPVDPTTEIIKHVQSMQDGADIALAYKDCNANYVVIYRKPDNSVGVVIATFRSTTICDEKDWTRNYIIETSERQLIKAK